MVLASQCLRTEVQDSDQQDMPTYTKKVISSATEVVRAAQALAASLEDNWYELAFGIICKWFQEFYVIVDIFFKFCCQLDYVYTVRMVEDVHNIFMP